MNNCIGIRKETKDVTERRVALTPDQVQQLIDSHQVRVLVEPSSTRIFRDEEYRDAGAEITNDLSPAQIVFGIKEIPISDILPNQTYCIFSHTIKGQPYNMPMLRQMADSGVTLFDYELVKNRDGRRVIFFGNYAGYVGMINTLWAYGQHQTFRGISTPFQQLKQTIAYSGLEEAKTSVAEVGKAIREKGLSEKVLPFICGFSGNGQVSRGAQAIFDLLPVEEIEPDDLDLFLPNKNGLFIPFIKWFLMKRYGSSY